MAGYPAKLGIKPGTRVLAVDPPKASPSLIAPLPLKGGFVDIKVCAVDRTWSGLKLVIRKENR